MESPTITSPSYILRPFKAEDVELWQKWDTDPEVQAFMPEPFNETQSAEEQYKYLKECQNDDEGYYWSIETQDGITIGTVALTEVSDYHGVANLGIVIGNKDHWGKGVATEVVGTLVNYALTQLNLSRICAEVEAGNTPMIKVLERVGFEQDGLFKSARVKNGKRIAVHHFSVIKQ